MKQLITFLRNWTLPVAMVVGVLMYFVFEAVPISREAHELTYAVVARYVQPALIFAMLFLSFAKVDPHDMRPHNWHGWLLVIQAFCFIVCSGLAIGCDYLPETIAGCLSREGLKVLCEGAMLCFICPTATASAVITGKLGGSISGVATYLMICNLMVSLLAPAVLTVVEPHVQLDFLSSFFLIMGKVFPLLICPLVAAWIVRFLLPKFHARLLGYTGLAFYIWAVSLPLVLTMTVRAIANSTVSVWYMVGLAVISLICCIVQFVIGKWLGSVYDKDGSNTNRVTAGQAFGQKNTVFVIWLALVFLNPITAVAGGFYSVWHNIINSYQLYETRKKQ